MVLHKVFDACKCFFEEHVFLSFIILANVSRIGIPILILKCIYGNIRDSKANLFLMCTTKMKCSILMHIYSIHLKSCPVHTVRVKDEFYGDFEESDTWELKAYFFNAVLYYTIKTLKIMDYN